MKTKISQLLLNLGTVILCISAFGCSAGKLPDVLQKNVWVPMSAQNVKYTMVGDTHQVRYADNVCFPAHDFINELVDKMRVKGWGRQDYDFINPGLQLNHKRGSGIWSHIVDDSKKNGDLYRWTEDFADSVGNIIRYWLQYRTRQNTKSNDTPHQIKSCSLEVLVIYYPKEGRH